MELAFADRYDPDMEIINDLGADAFFEMGSGR